MRYEPFLPGHYYRGREGKMHRWYTRDWMDYAAVKDNYTPAAERNAAPASIGRTAYGTQVTAVHDALETAVQRQLMSDVPYGVCSVADSILPSSLPSPRNMPPNASRQTTRQMPGGRSSIPSPSA